MSINELPDSKQLVLGTQYMLNKRLAQYHSSVLALFSFLSMGQMLSHDQREKLHPIQPPSSARQLRLCSLHVLDTPLT